ncbi:hypothetical protein D3C79_911010 [compost metagenome]
MYPLRISQSISSTRLLVWLTTAARLAQTKVLPIDGLTPVSISTLLLACIMAKCRLVRRLRMASMARSVGFPTASSWLCL